MSLGDWLDNLRSGTFSSHRLRQPRGRHHDPASYAAMVQTLEPRQLLSVANGVPDLEFGYPHNDAALIPLSGSGDDYDPDEGWFGADTFVMGEVNAEEGYGFSQVFLIEAEGINTAPLGVEDSYRVVTGEALTMQVGANDADEEGDPIAEVEILEGPEHGSLEVQGTAVTYTPEAGYTGEDTFTYRPHDAFPVAAGGALTPATTVTLNIFDPAGVSESSLGSLSLIGGSSGAGGSSSAQYTSWTGTTELPLDDPAVIAAAEAQTQAQNSASQAWSASEETNWYDYQDALAADTTQRQFDLATSEDTYLADRSNAAVSYLDEAFDAGATYIDAVGSANAAFSSAIDGIIDSLSATNSGGSSGGEAIELTNGVMADIANVIEGLQPAYDALATAVTQGHATLVQARLTSSVDYRTALTTAAAGYLAQSIGANLGLFGTAYRERIDYLAALLGAAEGFQSATAQAQATHEGAVRSALSNYRDLLEDALDTFDQSANQSVDSARDLVRQAFAQYVQAEASFREGTSDVAAWRQAQKDLAVALAGVHESRTSEGAAALMGLVGTEQSAMQAMSSDLAHADRQLMLDMADAQQAHDEAVVQAVQGFDDAQTTATATRDGALITANGSLGQTVISQLQSWQSTVIGASQAYSQGVIQAASGYDGALIGAASAIYEILHPNAIAASGDPLGALLGAATGRIQSLSAARGAFALAQAAASTTFRTNVHQAGTTRAQRDLVATSNSELRRHTSWASYHHAVNDADRQHAEASTSQDEAYVGVVAAAVQAENMAAIQEQVSTWQAAAAEQREAAEQRDVNDYALPENGQTPASFDVERFTVDSTVVTDALAGALAAAPTGSPPPANEPPPENEGEEEDPADALDGDIGQFLADLPQLTTDAFAAMPEEQKFSFLQQMSQNALPNLAEMQAVRSELSGALQGLSAAEGQVILEMLSSSPNPPTGSYSCIVRYGAGNPFPFQSTSGYAESEQDEILAEIFIGEWAGVDTTWIGTGGSIILGLVGVDVYKDFLDISHNLVNWQWSWSHAGTTMLNAVSFLPIVGTIKYADEGATLVKQLDDATEAVAEAALELQRKRSVLRQLLLDHAGGVEPYPVVSQAHHIFPVDWFGDELGSRLRNWGVDLNGTENGVLLPKFHYHNRRAAIHRGGNSDAYLTEVRAALSEATDRDSALSLIEELRQRLLNGYLAINGAE
jgi:hypothetical protein